MEEAVLGAAAIYWLQMWTYGVGLDEDVTALSAFATDRIHLEVPLANLVIMVEHTVRS